MSARVVVLGYIVRGPLGGLTWHHVQYLLGLQALGHDVWFVEQGDDYPSCYDPVADAMTTDPTYGLRYAEDVLDRVGLASRCAFFDTGSSTWMGAAAPTIESVLTSADVVLNVSGVNAVPDVALDVPHRVLIDTDPGFTQVRHLTNTSARAAAERHNAFFTFAENVGDGANLPDDGFGWRPTRQPVHIPSWPVEPPPLDGAFTTVMQWDSYPAVAYDGVVLDMKSRSFIDFLSLPSLVPGEVFELAVGSPTTPREQLTAAGWRLTDPVAVSVDPWRYQSYLQGSKAEFSVAKHGYVSTSSGWFSERSAGYLASGRPVVTQDTGFSRHLPTGEGVVAFTTLDEAAAAVDDVCADYGSHARRAREIAASHFDAKAVLGALLEQLHSHAGQHT